MCIGSILIGATGLFVRSSSLNPLTMGFYRMLFALPFFALWMREEIRRPMDYKAFIFQNGLGIIFAGLFFSIDLGLWNWAVRHTTIVNSTLFNNTAAFFIPLTLWLIYRQKPSLRVIITASIGFLGCTFLTAESFSISYDNLLGDVVSMLTGLVLAFYIIALQKVRTYSPPGFLLFWISFCATCFLGFFCYITESSFSLIDFQNFAGVLSQALLVQVCGQGLFAYAIDKVSTAYAGIVLFLAPVTGAILGWMLYDESLSHLKLFGMALIMMSIFTIKRKGSSL